MSVQLDVDWITRMSMGCGLRWRYWADALGYGVASRTSDSD